jgi:hypothetical protein
MGKKLEEFIGTKLCEIGLDWWEAKQEEFYNLPFSSKENQTISYHGEVEEWDTDGKSRNTFMNVNFNFLMYAKDSEKHYGELDSVMRLTNYGALDKMQFRIVPGLESVKEKILEAIDKDASFMAPSYDFKLFIDMVLSYILSELEENTSIVDNSDYTLLIQEFYKEIHKSILHKHKYKYDASESCSPPSYDRYPIKLNIEQLAAIAVFICNSTDTLHNKNNLLNHLSNSFCLDKIGVNEFIKFESLDRAYRKINVAGHPGSGLKFLWSESNKIMDKINKANTKNCLIKD